MQAPRCGQPPIDSSCCPQTQTQLQAPQAGIPIATNRNSIATSTPRGLDENEGALRNREGVGPMEIRDFQG